MHFQQVQWFSPAGAGATNPHDELGTTLDRGQTLVESCRLLGPVRPLDPSLLRDGYRRVRLEGTMAEPGVEDGLPIVGHRPTASDILLTLPVDLGVRADVVVVAALGTSDGFLSHDSIVSGSSATLHCRAIESYFQQAIIFAP